MKLFRSITARILGISMSILVLLCLGVFVLTKRTMVRIVEESQRTIYDQQLRGVTGFLEQAYLRLEATGRIEVYDKQFKEMALRNLAAIQESSQSGVELVAFDRDGALLFPRGDAMTRLRGMSPPAVPAGKSSSWEGILRTGTGAGYWGYFTTFSGWAWTVGYAMPVEVRYAEVSQFQRRFLLVLVPALVMAALVMAMVVAGITNPIHRLTVAATTMASGDLSADIGHGGEDDIGILAAALTTLRDTIRRKIEDLAEKNDALTNEVVVCSRAEAALQEALDSLARQNESLKTLDRMKDGLVRDVTHELKTPVAKMQMQMEIMTDLLKRHGLMEEAGEILATISRTINRQESTIRNILNLSRLEGGGRQYSRELFGLKDLLEEALQEYNDLLRTHGFTVERRLDQLEATGDRQMLCEVVANLLDNAIKYRRKEGDRRLGVATAARGNWAEVVIEDNGIGMSPAEIERAFDRFFQAAPSSEGCGVGLSICRAIIHDQGGTIAIESPGHGRGTTVRILLPRA